MKILYVSARKDPRDHNQGSGIDYEFYNLLNRKGAEVYIAGPYNFDFSLIERGLMKIHSFFFNTRFLKFPVSYFYRSGKAVNQMIEEVDPDVIVTKVSAPLLFAKIDRPLIYMCDATVQWMKGRWKSHSNLALLGMSIWEPISVKKSHRVITFSESNASVLKTEYGIPSENILVFPVPASIPPEMVPASINTEKSLSPIKLLLVGREWERKGIDVASEIVNQLKERNIPVELRVVGLEGENTESIKFMGLYNKTNPEELAAYISHYRWANILLHPARYEPAGIVPGEAAAFGVPTLTNDVGGLATTVEDGVSGFVFPANSPAEFYAEKIVELMENPNLYWQLVKTTKTRYEVELNWPAHDDAVFDWVEDSLRDKNLHPSS